MPRQYLSLSLNIKQREKNIMSQVEINIETDNAAFDEEGMATEVGRILRDLAGRIELDGIDHLILRDINGNRVGDFDIFPTV